MAEPAGIGVYGLGVMGRNLALQLAEKGVPVAAFDPWPDARRASEAELAVAASAQDFVKALDPPGAILLMVKAGQPVDDAIATLAPTLSKGAILADGGNSHFRDDIRRAAELAPRGISFLGVGISGGEEGARHGASVMAGGERAAFDCLAPTLERIAAKAGDSLCLAWLGPAGAGHFAKMVHNGLEYADMQLIAEAVLLLRHPGGLDWPAIADVAASWNQGPGACYLLEITVDVLRRRDSLTGRPLIDMIVDRAEQKGTGQWGAVAALELGIPAPTLISAVEARALSAVREIPLASLRAEVTNPPTPAEIGAALLAAKIAVYDQGFSLLAAASREYRFGTDLALLAEIWRAGCIIRGALLDPIAAALRASPPPARLLASPWLRDRVAERLTDWRSVTAAALDHGVPVPALASALAYHDGLAAERTGASLIQLLRDTFGAHGFERVDRPGRFHIDRPQ
jgi:6-phosphogluconate dehydrogenase